MSLVAERTLRTAIREKHFERAYCFHGEDDFQKDHAVRELTAAAAESATRDFNVDVLRGNEVSAETLDTLLGTPPMMAERRVIVVRDAHGLTRAARATVDRYLARPSPDTVLLLVVPAAEKPEPSWLERACAIEFPSLAAERVPRWIAHYASTTLGTEITPEAAALLQRAVGTDLGQLAGELDKLTSYGAGRTITEAAVADVVGVRHGESLGDLLDAVAAGDSGRAADLAPRVLAQPKMSLVQVIMALTTQTVAIGWGAARPGRRGPGGVPERDYYALLKETRVYPGRSWSEAVPAWARAAGRWSPAAIDTALDLLLAADRAAKETRHSSDEQLLGWLVLALCATGPRAAA
jgi:DNA polymerase-3 subunit delta